MHKKSMRQSDLSKTLIRKRVRLLSAVERRLFDAVVHDKGQEVGDVEDDANGEDDQADAPGHLARAVRFGALSVPGK